jgi:hypothetical protein
VREHGGPVLVQVLHQLEAGCRAGDQPRQCALAQLERAPAQVLAVKLEQVEGEKHSLRVDPVAVPQQVESGEASAITDRNLAVDHARRGGQLGDSRRRQPGSVRTSRGHSG